MTEPQIPRLDRPATLSEQIAGYEALIAALKAIQQAELWAADRDLDTHDGPPPPP